MSKDAGNDRDYCAASHVLDISISQIKNAMTSGEAGIRKLSKNFVRIAESADKLAAIADADEDGVDRKALKEVSDDIRNTMHASMEPFQFYDRLTQRMEHVMIALEHLTHYTILKQQINKEDVFKKILTCYTLEDEKELLENLLEDIDYRPEDNHHLKSTGSVELF